MREGDVDATFSELLYVDIHALAGNGHMGMGECAVLSIVLDATFQ